MKASEFKAKCLQLIDDVAAGGGDLVVTKNGKPLVRLVPYHEKPATLFGRDTGRAEIHGDLVAPLDIAWEADRE